jgi:hypothetical protein
LVALSENAFVRYAVLYWAGTRCKHSVLLCLLDPARLSEQEASTRLS